MAGWLDWLVVYRLLEGIGSWNGACDEREGGNDGMITLPNFPFPGGSCKSTLCGITCAYLPIIMSHWYISPPTRVHCALCNLKVPCEGETTE